MTLLFARDTMRVDVHMGKAANLLINAKFVANMDMEQVFVERDRIGQVVRLAYQVKEVGGVTRRGNLRAISNNLLFCRS